MPDSQRNSRKVHSSQVSKKKLITKDEVAQEVPIARSSKSNQKSKPKQKTKNVQKRKKKQSSSGEEKHLLDGAEKQPSKKRSRTKNVDKGRKKSAYLFHQFCALVCGICFGGMTCIALMYQKAQKDVASWVNPMIIPPPQQKIYTAPLRFSVGQKLPISQLREFLLDAGYVEFEKEPTGKSFIIKENTISLRSDAGDLYTIDINNDRIAQIKKGDSVVVSMQTSPIPLYTIQTEDRQRRKIPIQEIPLVMQQGVVAVEDSRFYEHEGIDPIGVARAIVINAISQSKSQGASTLTQQIVKNLILEDAEKTYARKMRELLRAIALERTLMESLARSSDPKQALKDKILEIYLNEVYLGHVNGKEVRGVAEGSEVFFGKPIHNIDLGEAATLAGIISSPNTYSPIRHLEKAQERRDLALMRMNQMEFISSTEKAFVQKEPLHVHYRPKFKKSPWFVDYMLSRIEKENIPQIDISTSLDPLLQQHAEQALKEGLSSLEKSHPNVQGVNGAIVVLQNRDASIVAMVGGRDYRSSSFNRSVYAKRQVGSIAKPFWAALAMEQDSSLFPGCWIRDQEIALGRGKHRWVPHNYDKKFLGAISLRDAMRTSRNIPFVHLYEMLKEQKGTSWLEERFSALGLEIPPYPSAVLGSFVASPLDVARAYTIFSNDGFLSSGSRWVSSQANFLTVDMMRSVMIDGTGKSIESFAPQRYLYGKSGTTDGARDAWFVAYDKDYTIAVWVGFDKDNVLGLGGSVAALPILGRFVDFAGLGLKEISKPSSIVFQDFCQDAPHCTTKESDLLVKGRTHNPRCSLLGEQIFQEEKKSFWASLFPF